MNAHFSFTRSGYDQCNLEKTYQESTQPFSYITDPYVTENIDACLHQSSPFMQNPFNNIPNSVIDIESELRGQTRKASKCPKEKYNPKKSKPIKHKWKECLFNKLNPEYTRVNKACNIFAGININRFDILSEDPQQLEKIHNNNYIGLNTRLYSKDTFEKNYSNRHYSNTN